MKVIDFYLEDIDGCVGDYVYIYDGKNKYINVLIMIGFFNLKMFCFNFWKYWKEKNKLKEKYCNMYLLIILVCMV